MTVIRQGLFLFLRVATSFAFCFFAAVPLYADMLFIGLNPAQGEINTARRVAESRSEQFFYWPQITKAQLAPIDALDQEEAKLLKEFEFHFEDMSEEESKEKQERMVAIQVQRQALREQLNVNATTLKTYLADLEKQNVKLTTVIISGHDGNGKYWGRYGDNLDVAAFTEAFAGAKSAASTIRTVALLGCYTTSVGALDTYWKKVFPNAHVFGGYGQKGPNSEIESGHQYLEAFLQKADKMAAAQTKEEFWKLFRNLPQIRILAASVVSSRFFVNNDGSVSLEQMYEACKGLRFDSDLRKAYTCYYQADPGCEDVPKSTSKGAVRLFYEELHEKAHCRAFLTVDDDHSLPKGEQVLNLIFFENMKGNFYRLYQRELTELDEWLTALGIPPLHLSTKPRSRAELMKDVRQTRIAVDNFGAAVRPNQASKNHFIKKFMAKSRLNETDKALLELSPTCAPSEWVDPMQTKTSPCVHSSEKIASTAEGHWKRWRNKGR